MMNIVMRNDAFRGVKAGFHPMDHGYDTFLGLPESNDYGCTDTTMGAPDSGCLNWKEDRYSTVH